MSIKQLDEWHLEHTSELVDYINQKGEDFYTSRFRSTVKIYIVVKEPNQTKSN